MADVENTAASIEGASLQDAELRKHPRHLCVDGAVLRLAIRPEFKGRRAILVDVSAGGIGFILEDPLEAGTMLTFDLQGDGEAQTVGRVARVRNSRPHPAPPDAPWLPPTPAINKLFGGLFGGKASQPKPLAWLVGCQFDRPLSEREICQLLDQLNPNHDTD